MSQETSESQALVQLMESISAAVARTARMEFLSMKQLLTSSEVEELYGINARTLAFKRSRGGGPDYIQEDEHGTVFYRHSDIDAYINRNRRRGS